MLLKEIFNEPYKSNDVVTRRRVKQQSIPMDSLKFRDQGYFTDIYDDPNNPHEIIRHSSYKTGKQFDPDDFPDNTSLSDFGKYEDAFKVYALALIRNRKISTNPFFPRIRAYNIAEYEHFYISERLFSIRDAIFDDNDHFREIALNLGNTTFKDFEDIVAVHDNMSSMDIMYKIIDMIQESFGNNTFFSMIQNPLLKEAILFIKSIKQKLNHTKNRVELDITHDNVMIRMTKLGPQLVITDPFS